MLVLELFSGVPLRDAVTEVAQELGLDLEALSTPVSNVPFEDGPIVRRLGLRCYVDAALPVVLYLAYKYHEPDQIRAALLANANAGGNTAHRGALLGALLGAAHGPKALKASSLVDGLTHKDEHYHEIYDFLDATLGKRKRKKKNPKKRRRSAKGQDHEFWTSGRHWEHSDHGNEL